MTHTRRLVSILTAIAFLFALTVTLQLSSPVQASPAAPGNADSLAIGAPGQTVNGETDAGAVIHAFGSSSGITADADLHSATVPTNGARFSHAVASGDFNGDGFSDLAVGAPDHDGSKGQVEIFYGNAQGKLDPSGSIFAQGNNLSGTADNNDAVGGSLATGDFNGDGYDDLAIGARGDDSNQGSVHIVYSAGASGLQDSGQAYLQQDDFTDALVFGTGGLTPTDSDFFGWALATGDINGDGADDLVIGVPLADIGGINNAGYVLAVYGGVNGLSVSSATAWDQNDLSSVGAETEDLYGHSLAMGDFNNDGFDDVAVGNPFEGIGAESDAGNVSIVMGAATGANTSAHTVLDALDYVANVESNDLMGFALSTGDFNDDTYADLLIGVPGEDSNQGAVAVFYGSMNGITNSGAAAFDQDSPGIPGGNEADDNFAFAVAAGDFNADGVDDAAIGVYLEDVGSGVLDQGLVIVLFGSAINGLSGTAAQDLIQGTTLGSANTTLQNNQNTGYALATMRAATPCSIGMEVANVVQLNFALGCFNAQTGGTHAITLTKDITLTLSTTVISNTTSAELTISGNTLYALDGNNSHRGLTINAGNVTVDGLTIRNGAANAGGGIYNAGVLMLDNSNLMNNVASGDDGAQGDYGSGDAGSNGEDASGGGIFNGNGGTLTINNSDFSNNAAIGGDGGRGGIYFGGGGKGGDGGAGGIGDGGAIYNNGTATLSNSTLTGNSATGGVGGAGGMPDTQSGSAGGAGGAGGAGNGGSVYNSGVVTMNASAALQNNVATGGKGGVGSRGDFHQGGGSGGNGGKGGSGGSGNGGAVYNSASATLSGSMLSANSVMGGAGSNGGSGDGSTGSSINLSAGSAGQGGNGGGAYGGGIYNSDSAEVINSTLSNNSAQAGHGASGGNGGSVSSGNGGAGGKGGNGGAGSGGSIYSSADLDMAGSTLSDSSVAGGQSGTGGTGGTGGSSNGANGASGAVGAGNGGGLGNGVSGNAVVRDNSTLSDNSAENGAGIHNAGDVAISSSTILSNTSSVDGGGIYNDGTATLTKSTISNNSARLGGGVNNRSMLTISDSTISNNASQLKGAGLFNRSQATVRNSSISGNSAGTQGGGFFADFGTAIIENSTLSGNSASGGGGGIHKFSGSLKISNTIIANSTGGDCTGSAPDTNYSLIEDGSCNVAAGTGNISNQDPMLGPLQPNDGPTDTQALLPGSQAINNGDSASCPPTDQRGYLRHDGSCDIGAFEVSNGSCAATVVGTPFEGFSVDASAVTSMVSSAPAGATVKVAGRCKGALAQGIDGGTITQTVYINKSLTLQGGHTPSSWDSAPNSTLYPTVLDADGQGRVVVLHNPGGSVFSTADVVLSHLTLQGGDAGAGGALIPFDSNGGGIFVGSHSDLSIVSSRVLGNHAVTGGGLYSQSNSDLEIIESMVVGNSAENEGAGVLNFGPLFVSGSTFANNAAGGNGGAIRTLGDVTLVNSTLSGNSAEAGGGLFSAGTTDIQNSTITANVARSGAGGIQRFFGNTTVQNSIVALNAGGDCLGTLSFDSSVDSDSSCGGSGVFTQGDLGPLQDNGGATLTHALQQVLRANPAIDTGDNVSCPQTDQRGFLRDGACDMGAYEFDGAVPTAVTLRNGGVDSLQPTQLLLAITVFVLLLTGVVFGRKTIRQP